MSRKMELSASRQVSPWILLWKNCKQSFEDAGRDDESQYLYLFCMLLCAFTLEAFLNHLLRLKFHGDWKLFERKASPKEKLKKISMLIRFDLDLGQPPFQTFYEIFDLRDNLTHAKTIQLEEVISYPIEDFLKSDDLPPMPITGWEEALTPDNAKKFFLDTQKMIRTLSTEAKLGSDPFTEAYSKTSWRGNI